VAAAALRETEREPELPREVRAQEVRQIGAVGLHAEPVRVVLPEAEMVVQEVALRVARDLVQRAPGGVLVERSVEQLLDPRGVEVLGRAAPLLRDGPYARPRILSCPVGGPDLDRAARERFRAVPDDGAILPGLAGDDVDVPPVRRPAMALVLGGG